MNFTGEELFQARVVLPNLSEKEHRILYHQPHHVKRRLIQLDQLLGNHLVPPHPPVQLAPARNEVVAIRPIWWKCEIRRRRAISAAAAAPWWLIFLYCAHGKMYEESNQSIPAQNVKRRGLNVIQFFKMFTLMNQHVSFCSLSSSYPPLHCFSLNHFLLHSFDTSSISSKQKKIRASVFHILLLHLHKRSALSVIFFTY